MAYLQQLWNKEVQEMQVEIAKSKDKTLKEFGKQLSAIYIGEKLPRQFLKLYYQRCRQKYLLAFY